MVSQYLCGYHRCLTARKAWVGLPVRAKAFLWWVWMFYLCLCWFSAGTPFLSQSKTSMLRQETRNCLEVCSLPSPYYFSGYYHVYLRRPCVAFRTIKLSCSEESKRGLNTETSSPFVIFCPEVFRNTLPVYLCFSKKPHLVCPLSKIVSLCEAGNLAWSLGVNWNSDSVHLGACSLACIYYSAAAGMGTRITATANTELKRNSGKAAEECNHTCSHSIAQIRQTWCGDAEGLDMSHMEEML